MLVFLFFYLFFVGFLFFGIFFFFYELYLTVISICILQLLSHHLSLINFPVLNYTQCNNCGEGYRASWAQMVL